MFVLLDQPRRVPLLVSEADLYDFYLPNGAFTSSKFELLSYISDNKKTVNSAQYLTPSGVLPRSESEGMGETRGTRKLFH